MDETFVSIVVPTYNRAHLIAETIQSLAEINYKKAHEIGNSKTTFDTLYDLYLNKLKDKTKANKLKEQFENK